MNWDIKFIEAHVVKCTECGTDFILPEALYTAAQNSDSIMFYCPYSHEMHFIAGEVENEAEEEVAEEVAGYHDNVIPFSKGKK